MTQPLLEVRDLVKHFPVRSNSLISRQVAAVRAVDGISFEVGKGETLGLVGESGCGKTTTGRLVARLLEPDQGAISFAGKDIAHYSAKELRPIRGQIQMIFQDPYASLNPRHTVGSIVAAPMEVNNLDPPGGRKQRVQELLETVGLNPEHYNRYPHQFWTYPSRPRWSTCSPGCNGTWAWPTCSSRTTSRSSGTSRTGSR
jgi:peptide/nickel transport system ATP-binding protein